MTSSLVKTLDLTDTLLQKIYSEVYKKKRKKSPGANGGRTLYIGGVWNILSLNFIVQLFYNFYTEVIVYSNVYPKLTFDLLDIKCHQFVVLSF